MSTWAWIWRVSRMGRCWCAEMFMLLPLYHHPQRGVASVQLYCMCWANQGSGLVEVHSGHCVLCLWLLRLLWCVYYSGLIVALTREIAAILAVCLCSYGDAGTVNFIKYWLIFILLMQLTQSVFSFMPWTCLLMHCVLHVWMMCTTWSVARSEGEHFAGTAGCITIFPVDFHCCSSQYFHHTGDFELFSLLYSQMKFGQLWDTWKYSGPSYRKLR